MDFSIPDNIVKQFDYVLVDLIRVRNETGNDRSFYFCGIIGLESKFDYNLLVNFILNILKPAKSQ